MSNHDADGRFLPGNKVARKGGKARAKALPAWRRREIAQQGFQAMVDKWFNGDRGEATRWLAATGLCALDEQTQEGDWFYRFPNPGPHPAHQSDQDSEEFPNSWY